MPEYRVQIIGADGEVAKEEVVLARDPDHAAKIATGETLIRGDKGPRKVLHAKVYWERGGTSTMVRFYREN